MKKVEMETMIEKWMADFQLEQPSQFFRDHPTNDAELVCSILTPKDFLIKTLNFFGLPNKYMDGEGHFADWAKKRLEEKKRGPKTKKKEKKQSKRMQQLIAQQKLKKGEKKDDSDVKPTHFDVTVFLRCYQRFIMCDGEVRSAARKLLLRDLNQTAKVFVDEHHDQSYKKCVDVHELALLLNKAGFDNLDNTMVENLGSILMCFGEVEYDMCYGERIPPDTDDDKREKKKLEKKLQEIEEARKEAEAAGEKFNEDDPMYKLPVIEPKKPIMMLLHLISITDMKFCCQKMFEFDKVLYDMVIQKFELKEEQQFMAMLTKKFKKKFYDEEPVYEMPAEPSKMYSGNAEIQVIVEKIDDLTTVPDAPDSLKNAFATTLFCMEAAFDSRSQDFLKYAFDAYPDRDYLIVTQPHTVVESQLLSKFTEPAKKTTNTFQHILYILHRDSLYNQDMYVQRISQEDLEAATELVQELDEANKFGEALYECAINPASTNFGFVAKVMDQIIGAFVLSKDVNLEYYTAHFHV